MSKYDSNSSAAIVILGAIFLLRDLVLPSNKYVQSSIDNCDYSLLINAPDSVMFSPLYEAEVYDPA